MLPFFCFKCGLVRKLNISNNITLKYNLRNVLLHITHFIYNRYLKVNSDAQVSNIMPKPEITKAAPGPNLKTLVSYKV